jgi:hypothetical protein
MSASEPPPEPNPTRAADPPGQPPLAPTVEASQHASTDSKQPQTPAFTVEAGQDAST